MKKFRLKIFYPIYRAGDKLCIGLVGTNHFVECDYSTTTTTPIIQNLLEYGYTLEVIKQIPLLNELLQKDMLEHPIEMPRTRNELFFQYLNIPFLSANTLNSRILILGAGAAGATTALLLAQFGFTNLFVVDNDVVEVSDIQKTVVYRQEHIGQTKVTALARILRENYNTDVRTFEQNPKTEGDLQKIFEESQPILVVKACDPDLDFRVFLNKICFDVKIPHIHLSYAFERINLGPFYIPGTTCCDNSFNAYVQTAHGEYNNFLKHQKLFSSSTTHPSISFNINLLANFALKEILFFFAQKHEYVQTIGQIIFFYPLTMQGTSIQLKCQEACPFSFMNECQKIPSHH